MSQYAMASKSTRMVVYQLIQADVNTNIQTSQYWLFVRGIYVHQPVMWKNTSGSILLYQEENIGLKPQ